MWMVGLPREIDARGERLGGPILSVVSLLVLGGSMIWAAFSEHGDSAYWTGTLAVAGATAVWLLGLIPLFPRRHRHPVLTACYYAGILLGAAYLVSRADLFTAFASMGYSLAFALFPARWSVFAVAATAAIPLLVKGGLGADAKTPSWVIVASVAGPMLYAAWFIGVESDRRRRANTALAETNAQLEKALEENAGLHAQLLTQAREAGVLDERQRMAREIHDTLAQGLTGIVTQLQAAERAVEDPPRHRRHLAQVNALARDSLSEARRAVQALRPEPLADSRLPDAVAELARRFAETSDADVRTETTGDARALLPELEITLYRVAQEALTNAGKHAQATRIGLSLSYSDDVVMLDVRDDGVGFRVRDVDAPRSDGSGFGLQSMRQRVHRVAGSLAVESAPGEGTAINAQVPAIPAFGGEDGAGW
ncbi:sensor histidine kinase [Amycolatopsis sp. NPDC059021]|uniref:sensor histidine kinase n=1 Tax=Amycolatopsis sp. NPDC059021 TaxID=3346704 RepID=UPI0036731B6D